MTALTDHERTDAAKALIRWFDSKAIIPGEAAIIMIEVLAQCLVEKTKDIRSLNESCENFRLGLLLNIAILLKPEIR
jgi:hypothetical protein